MDRLEHVRKPHSDCGVGFLAATRSSDSTYFQYVSLSAPSSRLKNPTPRFRKQVSEHALREVEIVSVGYERVRALGDFFERTAISWLVTILSIVSAAFFTYYYANGLGLAYNDARSHLDIGRRVVEGLKPGLAQLGSVWLPLTHLFMALTIWNDFMWHSGLSGALESMIAFVATSVLIYAYLRVLGVDLFGRIVGVCVFVANINMLYLQSTAMTELMLIATMTAGAYELLRWFLFTDMVSLIKSAFWIMLSTLVRYDGWFLLVFATGLVFVYIFWKRGYATAEGTTILFATLAGFGIVLWFLWNLLIFKDPLYFVYGPYSAYTQQRQLESAGVLATKHNLFFSLTVYFYALAYNSGALVLLLGVIGMIVLFASSRVPRSARYASGVLTAPFFFNVIALYMGHSVLFVEGLSGDTWFNVRYGIMLLPSLAVFIGYLTYRARSLRPVIVGALLLVTFFQFTNSDAVTIEDARVGSSQKNVSEVSGWLAKNTKDEKGFILISAASHDAIIFSSGLPMKKFIHEGTGVYWKNATEAPEQWARWIIMRTNSDDDSTWRLVKSTPGFLRYDLVGHYPFADIYQLRYEYLEELNTAPILPKE